MKAEIIVGLIGGFTTIAAPLVAIKYQNYIDNKSYSYPSKSRIQFLNGEWEGETVQKGEITQEIKIVKLFSEIKTKGKNICGEGEVRWDNNVLKVNFKGGFINDYYIRLDYNSVKSHIVNFGSILFKLNSDTNKMVGSIVGYGNIEEGIITGTVTLNKK